MILPTIMFSYASLVILFYTGTPGYAAEQNSGKQYFAKYCASCHGIEGKGNGPISRDLNTKPADLTVIKKNNGGIFPLNDVMATIDGRRFVRAHGDREMPVWGEIFYEEIDRQRYKELTTLLKAKIIAEYIATLQR